MEILAIVFIVFALYGTTLKYEMIIDDMWFNKMFRGIGKRRLDLSFIKDLFFSGRLIKNIFWDRAFSLSMFAVIPCLVYLCFGSNEKSFLAAVLYACSPINTQIAIWLNARRYLTSTILVLLFWLTKPAGVLFLLGIPFMQVCGLPAPILLLTTKYWALVPIWTFVLWLNREPIVNYLKSRKQGLYGIVHTFDIKKFPVAVKTVAYYLAKCLFTEKLTFHKSYLQFFGITKDGTDDALRYNLNFIVSCCGIGGFALAGCLVGEWFAVLWFFLFISVFANFKTVTMTLADRYVCLASIGVYLVLAKLLLMIPFGIYILTALLSSWIYVIWNGKKIYKDLNTYYRHQNNIYSECIATAMLYQKALLKQGCLYDAFVVLRRSLELFPNDFRLNLFTARCLVMMGYKKEAIPFIDMAEKEAKNNIYMPQEEIQAAIKEIKSRVK